MGSPDQLAAISAHAGSALAAARRHSLCLDDAHDAYQRAIELYLRNAQTVRPATAGPWLRTVARNEAIRLRDQRQRLVAAEEIRFERQQDVDAREPSERAAELERVARAAEALHRCKPHESTALLLKASGATYKEISSCTGWSATKVNRVITEGRRSFLGMFASIEEGAACEPFNAILSAVADGDATPEDYRALRPHLRHCASCRASLRGMYDAQPALGALAGR